jgi:hypothetical protein
MWCIGALGNDPPEPSYCQGGECRCLGRYMSGAGGAGQLVGRIAVGRGRWTGPARLAASPDTAGH